MINLLPQEIKQDIFYARRNTKLRLWILGCLAALAGVVIIVAGGLLYMQQSINNYTKQIAESQRNLEVQKVSETQKRVDEISGNTKLAVQVLSKEILFSKMLRQLGAALPNDSVLKTLEIDNGLNNINLNAAAGNYNSATQIQLNLQDPKNGVFEKADINNVTCTPAGGANPTRYPCDIGLRALFKKNNSFLYIAPSAQGVPKP